VLPVGNIPTVLVSFFVCCVINKIPDYVHKIMCMMIMCQGCDYKLAFRICNMHCADRVVIYVRVDDAIMMSPGPYYSDR